MVRLKKVQSMNFTLITTTSRAGAVVFILKGEPSEAGPGQLY